MELDWMTLLYRRSCWDNVNKMCGSEKFDAFSPNSGNKIFYYTKQRHCIYISFMISLSVFLAHISNSRNI
jgi:hypothetical protein